MCCPLSGSGDCDTASTVSAVYLQKFERAECCECSVEFTGHGERAIFVSCKCDCDACLDDEHDECADAACKKETEKYHTCAVCLEIRNHFDCGDGFTYGQLWEDIAENFFPSMVAGGHCLTGLSPSAKNDLFEAYNAWFADGGSGSREWFDFWDSMRAETTAEFDKNVARAKAIMVRSGGLEPPRG